jgi:hypothetical protein
VTTCHLQLWRMLMAEHAHATPATPTPMMSAAAQARTPAGNWLAVIAILGTNMVSFDCRYRCLR